MAWYDSIVSTYDTIANEAGDLVNEYISSESDRASEKIRNPVVKSEEVQQPQTQARVRADAGFNWQAAGVVVAGFALAVTVYKLAT